MPDLEKPAHGAPCNGCGGCCRAMLCPLGSALFGRFEGPCPALVPEGEKFRCGCVTKPLDYAPPWAAAAAGEARLREAALLLIGAQIGGCDACLVGEPYDKEFGRKCRSLANRTRKDASKAAVDWGLRQQFIDIALAAGRR